MKKKKIYKIYDEPFITYWPMPLSLRDLKECFRVKPKKSMKNKIKYKRIEFEQKLQENYNAWGFNLRAS